MSGAGSSSSDTKIAKVTCWVLRMPYSVPLIDESRHQIACFIEIETEAGLKGHAVSSTRMPHGIREFINREAGPMIVGMDASRPEQVRNRLFWETLKFFTGAWSQAASLIDIALWDLKGKALGSPVWKLLGGSEKKLPVYVTFGFSWLDEDQLVALARHFIAEGHTRLKMTAGAILVGPEENRVAPDDKSNAKDAKRVQLVRETIGPDVELMVDGNKSLGYEQGFKLARLLEPFDLTWFEDPLIQGDPRLYARLRNHTSIPIAAGSTGTSDLTLLREYLVLEAVDYLQPNVRDIGGYTQGVKAAGLAKAFNVPLSMGGGYPHQNMHLLGGVSQNARVEFHVPSANCVVSLFDGAALPDRDGTVSLSEEPGLGLTPKDGILDLVVD